MSVSTNKAVTFFDGDYFPSQIITLTNQTGSAIAIGNVAAINMDMANTTYDELVISDSNGVPNPNYFAGTAILPTVNNVVAGINVIALEPIAVGARGKFMLTGLTRISTAGTVAAGVFIYGTGALQATFSATAGTQAILDALALPTAILGRVIEGRTGAGLCLCWFNGYNPPIVGGGA